MEAAGLNEHMRCVLPSSRIGRRCNAGYAGTFIHVVAKCWPPSIAHLSVAEVCWLRIACPLRHFLLNVLHILRLGRLCDVVHMLLVPRAWRRCRM